jgi:hypothetical protein
MNKSGTFERTSNCETRFTLITGVNMQMLAGLVPPPFLCRLYFVEIDYFNNTSRPRSSWFFRHWKSQHQFSDSKCGNTHDATHDIIRQLFKCTSISLICLFIDHQLVLRYLLTFAKRWERNSYIPSARFPNSIGLSMTALIDYKLVIWIQETNKKHL